MEERERVAEGEGEEEEERVGLRVGELQGVAQGVGVLERLMLAVPDIEGEEEGHIVRV